MIQKGDGKFRTYLQLEDEFDDRIVLLTRRGEHIRLGEGYVEFYGDNSIDSWDRLWNMAGEMFPNDGSIRHVYRYKGEPLPWIKG